MSARNHKDTLFQALFGAAEFKGNLLSLFNALNGTDYSDENDLEINTIGNAIYMGMKNDVSCILDGYLSLHEHQSTFNPNMPLRGLMYFGKLYDKYVKVNRKNIYGSSIVKIPTPKYYVLYNGNEDLPDATKLRLSDAFIQPDGSGDFEWTAVMLNINLGHNGKILSECPVLREYAVLVARVKSYRSTGLSIADAVEHAVDDCIRDGILHPYLTANKAEVVGMCITEYNEEETMLMFKEEGRAEERAKILKELLELGIDLDALRPGKGHQKIQRMLHFNPAN